MLKINWIRTDEYYHRILAAPGAAARRQLYVHLLVAPWLPMMQMMRRPSSGEPPDPLDGARAWTWLLPDQVDAISTILERMEAVDAWNIGEEALGTPAARFNRYGDRLPFDEVTSWLVLADPVRSNPLERGYTGATDWLSPRIIGQF